MKQEVRKQKELLGVPVPVFMLWVQAAKKDADTINTAEGTNYTPEDVFKALDTPLTIKGAAERFVAEHGNRIRFDQRQRVWFHAEEGRLWSELQDEQIMEFIVHVVRGMQKEPRIIAAAKRCGIISHVAEGRDKAIRDFSIDNLTTTNLVRIERLLMQVLSVPNQRHLPIIRTRENRDVWLQERQSAK